MTTADLLCTGMTDFPIDETEQIQTLNLATGGKAVMSQYAALKQRGLSDAEAEAELEQINEENAAVQPLQLGVIDNGE